MLKRILGARLPLLLAMLALIGCEDSTGRARPANIEITGDNAAGPAGMPLASAPGFVVRDQQGNPLGGAKVTITVAAGGGSLVGSPTETIAGTTPIGAWTLGAAAGPNELLVAVDGLEPVRIKATGVPGAPGKLAPLSPQSAVGQVATAFSPLTQAVLMDAFGNPLPGVAVTVAVSGGSAPAKVVSLSDGTLEVAGWVLGTVSGNQTLTLTAGGAALSFNVLARPGPPESLAVISGGSQSARAGTSVPQPIRFVARDGYGNPADNVSVSFAVIEGGGSISSVPVLTDGFGMAAAPAWRLGLHVAPQRIRATAGALSAEAAAAVSTEYSIDVRFFGPAMSESRRAAFNRAAQRLSAIIVGDLPAVQTTNADVASTCGVTGTAPLAELIDDIVIFATIKPIDKRGQVLGSAGPCFIRSGRGLPVIGVMQFDEFDIADMESAGTFEGVIMHEMLHVVGIGTMWDAHLSDRGTVNVGFTGQAAKDRCLDTVGSRCALSVPVEDFNAGAGTSESHWRESIFDNELMTGYVDRGGMPLSTITIGSLSDIGYVVNYSAGDTFPGKIAAARLHGEGGGGTNVEGWERTLQPRREISRTGRVTEIE